ncbi:hypothetical protein BGW36DRAFT_296767 [Talaromyces proteolyticus]|uniref:Ubiquitin carboxyl-terminal hydrolase 19 n=1 Tax=Talaromyces proteolyticus TaxID=1131652 RepID=A0AAD4PV39_9EURO|nr:uncharacterized protein BGW36DRAFT_296767 [Talaromyces proteolyticus]KAH8696065.1 hypothetical protein BGW36DRAFT_296767 [Talaromyces proteolyticus]
MDAQYPFASREDIWRVFEEVKDLYSTQLEHGERIARLERRREDDMRLKSVWGPLSQFPSAISGSLTEPSYTPAVDTFKGFDQGHHHSIVGNMNLENEEEPRRGASRANSVRFDESAIHGYYDQVNRSATELPLRTGSGMSSHPLIERSLSHRSDGRQSSSGHSHHSARTSSMGTDAARLLGSSGGSPASSILPPPGLFLLGPVPCIIRCWLTTNFSNETLLYAAVCSGSYTSFLGYSLVEKLGYEDQVTVENGFRFIKLPLYLPEASIHQSSSRAGSPTPQLPSVTIRFAVRDTDPDDKSLQIFMGSDVLRSHNADILFSQDKIIMMDDDRNKVSVPLVRPENDMVFKSLSTRSDISHEDYSKLPNDPESDSQASISKRGLGVIEGLLSQSQEANSGSPRVEETAGEASQKPLATTGYGQPEPDSQAAKEPKPPTDQSEYSNSAAKGDIGGVWGSWRRETRADGSSLGMAKATRGRAMKVLRPSRSSSSRGPSISSTVTTTDTAIAHETSTAVTPSTTSGGPDLVHPTPSRSTSFKSGDGSWPANKNRASNPIGGASAFGWLNPS